MKITAENIDKARRCDRCQETSRTVRWVSRIGGNLCSECRRHERQS